MVKISKHITIEKQTLERALRLMVSVIKDDKTLEVVMRAHYGSDSSFFEGLIEAGLLEKQKEWEAKKKKLGIELE
jgi:hypothetical protein